MSSITVPSVTLSPNATAVLEKRYLLRNEDGDVIETPDEMWWRVAKAVAYGESLNRERAPSDTWEYWTQEFHEIMANLRMIPNSPTLMNAGTPYQNLSACFVLGGLEKDSMEGIMEAARAQALVLKWGGGCGFSLSHLRPENDHVRSTHRVACGPISVLRFLQQTSKMITQGGRRAGANMAILDVSHPDIMKFVHCKDDDPQAISDFNISVAVSDAFMSAVEADREWEFVNPRTGRVTETVSARDIFMEIVDSAWHTGDPGLFFIDQANRVDQNPVLRSIGRIETTNPCGEVPLHSWDACNLASLNLAAYVRPGDGHPHFDLELFKSDIWTAIRFLDDVITVNQFPLEEIRLQVDRTRRVGLGVMGLHDALIALGIPYESQDALIYSEIWARILREEADKCSLQLAEERGVYEAWEPPHPAYRNAWRLSIAPTGTISIIAGTSNGIEPWFSLAHIRKTYDGMELPEINQELKQVLWNSGHFDAEIESITEKLLGGHSLQRMDVLQGTKDLFRTAMEISPAHHIRMQSVWQTWVDAGVSKTINLPNSATRDDITASYLQAWRSGCKGLTVFRDNCREGGEQVLNHILAKSQPETAVSIAPDAPQWPTEAIQSKSNGRVHLTENGHVSDVLETLATPVVHTNGNGRRKLPERRESITHRFQVGDQEGYLHIGLYPERQPGEVFITMSKEGSTVSGLMDAWATMCSLALQYGMPLETIVRKFKGARFEPAGMTSHPQIRLATSVLDFVVRLLELEFLQQPAQSLVEQPLPVLTGETCPNCGQMLVAAAGCLSCESCGIYEKCG